MARNFQSISSFGKLILFKNCEEGDIVVEYGTFLGESTNQYGSLFNFCEVDSNEKITLQSTGKLKWLFENGSLIEGKRYQVRFLGEGKIEKGTWKGKSFFNIDVLEDLNFKPFEQSSFDSPMEEKETKRNLNPVDQTTKPSLKESETEIGSDEDDDGFPF